MAYGYFKPDFVVRKKEGDDDTDIAAKILNSIVVNRLKFKKPVIWFIGGDSGEGKSFASLKIQELLCSMQGIDYKEFINDINVYTPLEYPKKLDALLHDKRLKKVNMICMHEAREIIKAKNWQSFLTQAIADVNAMSRSVKPMCILIISQFIRDITTDVRYTLTYYSTITRSFSKPPELQIYKMRKNDYNLEKPTLEKYKIKGYIVNEKNKYYKFQPPCFQIGLVDKDIQEVFEKSDREAKAYIIKNKLNKLIKEMQKDIGDNDNKVNIMVDYYISNQEALKTIGKRKGKKFIVNDTFRSMHEMTSIEEKQFTSLVIEKLDKTGGDIFGCRMGEISGGE